MRICNLLNPAPLTAGLLMAGLLTAGLLTAGLLGGCTTSSTQMTESQKQDEIMAHPMDYKPDIGGDVSGGDTGNFDSSGFNHDMKSVLMP